MIDYDSIRKIAVEFACKRGWQRKLAKKTEFEQTLFNHSITCLDALLTLLKIISMSNHFNFSEDEQKTLIVATLAHDVGKETDEWQKYVLGMGNYVTHIDKRITYETVKELAEHFCIKDIQSTVDAINLHMSRKRTGGNVLSSLISGNHLSERWKLLLDIVNSVDNLVSANGLFSALDILENPISCCFSEQIKSSYHLIQIRGVSSCMLHRAALDCFIDKGWHPLTHYSNGTIYITDSTVTIQNPDVNQIKNKLEKLIEKDVLSNDLSKSVVAKGIARGDSPIPTPEFFDYRQLTKYLEIASNAGSKGPNKYAKDLEKDKKKGTSVVKTKVMKFLEVLEEEQKSLVEANIKKENLSDEDMNKYSQMISLGQQEVRIFKFFKATFSEEVLYENGLPVLKEEQKRIEEVFSKAVEKANNKREKVVKKIQGKGSIANQEDVEKIETVYRQSIEDAENKKAIALQKTTKRTYEKIREQIKIKYDELFGIGSFDALENSPNNDLPIEFAKTVHRYWSLLLSKVKDCKNGEEKVFPKLQDDERISLLIDKLNQIYKYVIEGILPEEFRPQLISASSIAKGFMDDLLHPISNTNISTFIQKQLSSYGESKPAAKKERGTHLCPICNQSFGEGKEVKVKLVANPEAHTNRAISHGTAGHVVICNICRNELSIQQIILGSQNTPPSMIVIFPKMNISYQSGNLLQQKINRLWNEAYLMMSEKTTDPTQKIDLSNTGTISKNIKSLGSPILNTEDILKLISYKPSEKYLDEIRKNVEKRLTEDYEDLPKDSNGNINKDESIKLLNEYWNEKFISWEEMMNALMQNKVDGARELVRDVFKLTPKFKIICQTPHMILIPLMNPIQKKIKNKDESNINAAIRELFISLLLGLSLDCSVAVVNFGEKITFEGGEGIAYVPRVPELRRMIGSEWVLFQKANPANGEIVNFAERWLTAIGSAAELAYATDYPARSDLYQILTSLTAGHILRRIEQKNNDGMVSYNQLKLIENIREVLV